MNGMFAQGLFRSFSFFYFLLFHSFLLLSNLFCLYFFFVSSHFNQSLFLKMRFYSNHWFKLALILGLCSSTSLALDGFKTSADYFVKDLPGLETFNGTVPTMHAG